MSLGTSRRALLHALIACTFWFLKGTELYPAGDNVHCLGRHRHDVGTNTTPSPGYEARRPAPSLSQRCKPSHTKRRRRCWALIALCSHPSLLVSSTESVGCMRSAVTRAGFFLLGLGRLNDETPRTRGQSHTPHPRKLQLTKGVAGVLLVPLAARWCVCLASDRCDSRMRTSAVADTELGVALDRCEAGVPR